MQLNSGTPHADNLCMKGTRRHDRNLCADLLKIHWTDTHGRNRKEVASLEDISTTGACIQLDEPLPLHTPLKIIHPRGKYSGKVKYCNFQLTGYFIGIEFDPGIRWSSRDFDPAHLLRFRLRIASDSDPS